MSYVYMGDLAGRKSRRRSRRMSAPGQQEAAEEGLGQNRQDSFWSWFFTGVGPEPKKAYKEASFKQQQAGAAQKANKAWKGMEYEAKAEEDLNPFEAQGYDAAQALGSIGRIDQWGAGLGQSPPVVAAVPAPVASSSTILIGALALGGLGALAYGAVTAKREAALNDAAREIKRLNGKRRNG